jgi:CRP/FNR family transcriptional regulator
MNITNDLSARLAFFSDPELQQELIEKGNIVTLKKGDVIVRDGQYIKFLPIVINSVIRVFQQKEDREIYFIM